MAATSPLKFWDSLPEGLRRLLARGSTGREHLAAIAAALLGAAAGQDEAGRARLALFAQEALFEAWASSPLSLDLALLLPGVAAPKPGPLPGLLALLPGFWRPPQEGDDWRCGGDWQRCRAGLLERLAREPGNLAWRALAWGQAWQLADKELAWRAVDPQGWPRGLEPVQVQASALYHLARGGASEALAALDAAQAAFPACVPGLRAECLLRLGRADEAFSLLTQAWARSPWRSSELLRATDLASGAADAVSPVPGSAAILLYTWNKAGELDETLASLAASDLERHAPGARIWVLDNGSSDATPQVLARWSQRLGERFATLRLPVNIGAPAARNWLLSLPEVREREFLIFLDDDVSLPVDWLGRLGAAASRHPEASAWGCRVVDEANPLVMQSVDYVPLAPRPQRALALPTTHLGQPDFGQFRYLRPCVSVTGCCHMLRSGLVDATGGFDIRFSPSQYDDLERDLRVFLGGGHAVYQGHLAVRHKRRSGAAAQTSTPGIGSAMGNMIKLEAKHGEAAFAAISTQGEDLLARDMERRFQLLAGLLRDGPSAPSACTACEPPRR